MAAFASVEEEWPGEAAAAIAAVAAVAAGLDNGPAVEEGSWIRVEGRLETLVEAEVLVGMHGAVEGLDRAVGYRGAPEVGMSGPDLVALEEVMEVRSRISTRDGWRETGLEVVMPPPSRNGLEVGLLLAEEGEVAAPRRVLEIVDSVLEAVGEDGH